MQRDQEDPERPKGQKNSVRAKIESERGESERRVRERRVRERRVRERESQKEESRRVRERERERQSQSQRERELLLAVKMNDDIRGERRFSSFSVLALD